MGTTNTPIIISLHATEDAQQVENADNFVHPGALQAIDAIIDRILPKATERQGDCSPLKRSHDAITIQGKRGSGKTTFLLSILHRLSRESGSRNGRNILSLGVIDPTLISAKDNLFLAIIASIQEQVSQKCHCHQREATAYKEWEKSLRDLAGGLAGLDDVGSNPLTADIWDDHHFILDEGLEKVKNNRCLESRFATFLNSSTNLLHCDALAIGIDDIDIMPERGWTVLEILRRYLTSPRLITFVAGDPELFSMLIRKKQWENLGDLATRYEPDRQDDWLRMIDHLEEQYITKILKPENSVFLDSLHRTHVLEGIPVNIKDSNNEVLTIESFLEPLIEDHLFVYREDDQTAYQQVLLRQPIRIVAQALRLISRSRRNTQDRQAANSAMIDGLVMILSNPLQKLSLTPHDLRDMLPIDIGPLVTTTLAKAGELDSGYRLFPDFGASSLNLAVIALGARVGAMMAAQPQAALEYMLKVGLTREIMLTGPGNPRERQRFLDAFLRYAGLDRHEETLSTARRASAVLRRNVTSNATTYRGTIALHDDYSDKTFDPVFSMYGDFLGEERGFNFDGIAQGLNHLKNATKQNTINKKINEYILSGQNYALLPDEMNNYSLLNLTDEEIISKYIDHIIKKSHIMDYIDENPWNLSGIFFHTTESMEKTIQCNTILPLFRLPLLRATAPENQRVQLLSVHSLIALLVRIQDCSSVADIDQLLQRSAQERSYPLPNDLVLSGNQGHAPSYGADQPVGQDRAPMSLSDDQRRLGERLHCWAQHWKAPGANGENRPLPAFAIAAIWTRFYYTLERYDEKEGRIYAGDAFQNMILAFLTAVLVEQCRYADHPSLQGITLQNHTTNESHFLNAVNDVYRDTIPVGLFGMVWSCPLWGYYLDHSSALFEAYQKNANRIGADGLEMIDTKPVTVNFKYYVTKREGEGEEDASELLLPEHIPPSLHSLYNCLLVRRPRRLTHRPASDQQAGS